jgi:hypothetical protein
MAIPVPISKKSHKYSTTFSKDFLHQISPKLENKYKNILAILKPIFRTLTINQSINRVVQTSPVSNSIQIAIAM